MKKVLIIVTFLVCAACQMQIVLQNEDANIEDGINSSGLLLTKSSAESRIVFLDETDFQAWTSIGPIMDRFKACDVEESEVKTMSTETLIESILHYPLNYLVLTSNNPLNAVKKIVEHSTIHREFIRRDDAADVILDIFAKTRPSRKMKWDNTSGKIELIPFHVEMMLDYLIGSGYIPEIFRSDNQSFLKGVLENKVREISQHPNLYSSSTLYSLSFIDSSFDFNSPQIFRNPRSEIDVFTPFGKPIKGLLRQEFDEDEIEEINSFAAEQYPNAIIRGSASRRYNCHSFAWHQNDTTNTVWINALNSSYQDQITKYYTDDLYISVPFYFGTHIRYANDDHSALILSSGKHLSKWGSWPLMEHYCDESPYDYSVLNYYSVQSLPKTDNTSTVIGPSVVFPNSINNYVVTHPSAMDTTYFVTCSYLVDNTPNAFSFTTTDSTNFQLTCHEYGAYKIFVNGYRGAYLYSVKEFLVVCVGALKNGIANLLNKEILTEEEKEGPQE